jgi:hypothetical protein
VRRGAARPRRSDQAAAGETLSRAGRRPHRRACMGCRAPAGAVHRNTVGRPSVRSLGVAAQEVRMPAVPSSPCPRPRPASSVRCPVSGVRCPVPSERPGVRCPGPVWASAVRGPVWASGVGVRCLSVAASAVSGRSEVLERGGGQAAYGWDGRGRRGRPLCPCPARGLPESEPRARSWRRRCWASGGFGLDLAVVVGGGGQWPARPRGRPG